MYDLEIGTQRPQGKALAINIATRNAHGEVTRYKYYESDSAAELSDIWEKNNMQKKPGKKKDATTK